VSEDCHIVWKGSRRGPYTSKDIELMLRTGAASRLAEIEWRGRLLGITEFLEESGSEVPPPAPQPAPQRNRATASTHPSDILSLRRARPARGNLLPVTLFGMAMAVLSVVFSPWLVLPVALATGIFLLTRRAGVHAGLVLIPAILLLLFQFPRQLADPQVASTQAPSAPAPSNQATATPMELTELHKSTRPAVVDIIALDKSSNPQSSGSGFFISPNEIVTNFHVIGKADSIGVILADGSETVCTAVRYLDKDRDLAVLVTRKASTHQLALETSRIEEGERIAVIGSPLGLDGTLSEGIVSAVRKNDDMIEFIQISAPISPGSSGSPVVNRFGKVVGVATMIFTEGQSLNFAVSSRELQQLLKSPPLKP